MKGSLWTIKWMESGDISGVMVLYFKESFQMIKEQMTVKLYSPMVT